VAVIGRVESSGPDSIEKFAAGVAFDYEPLVRSEK